MTQDERMEVAIIGRKAGEMISILNRYLCERTLFADERKALDWLRIRIDLVCRIIFHEEPVHTEYELTHIEGLFFLRDGGKYLMAGSYPIDCIQKEKLCRVDSDSYVLSIIDYLLDIQRECAKAEITGILPKEESWDVEY